MIPIKTRGKVTFAFTHMLSSIKDNITRREQSLYGNKRIRVCPVVPRIELFMLASDRQLTRRIMGVQGDGKGGGGVSLCGRHQTLDKVRAEHTGVTQNSR